MAKLKAIVFDYYETLAEIFLATLERIFDDLARRVGVDLPLGEGYRHWRELTPSDWKLRLGGLLPLDGPAPTYRRFWDIWLEQTRELFAHWGADVPPETGADACAAMHAEAVAYPEVPGALKALRGRYRLAVLSDADSDFLHESIRRNGFTFDAVITSDEMRAYKPHVSLFRYVCERLGVTPERAAYVGDSPWADIAGARHAGLRAAWVNRHGARWPDDIDPPTAEIASLSELADVLA